MTQVSFLAKCGDLCATGSPKRPFSKETAIESGCEICNATAKLPELENRLLKRDFFVNDSTGLFAALDRSIADTAKQAQLDTKIFARMRELMRENGLAYDYSEEKALEQAMLEVTGAPAK